MTQPTVCAVVLTADRPEMARRAVECFRAQTYPAKRLLIYDTGADEDCSAFEEIDEESGIHVRESRAIDHHGNKKTIGYLRNRANAQASEIEDPHILIHWDDDDWSHPNRIAEQVELLQSGGADVVGYNEMLFWREPQLSPSPGEACLYSNGNRQYALGTSLCYWRKTWEAKPFPATSRGEDLQFCVGLKVHSISGLNCSNPAVAFGHGGPAMIARIHAGNTSAAYAPANMASASEWRRVPEWDQYCRSVME